MVLFRVFFCHGKLIKICGEEGGRFNLTAPANTIYINPFLPRSLWKIFYWEPRWIFFTKFN